jgi:hypothetical protein
MFSNRSATIRYGEATFRQPVRITKIKSFCLPKRRMEVAGPRWRHLTNMATYRLGARYMASVNQYPAYAEVFETEAGKSYTLEPSNAADRQ